MRVREGIRVRRDQLRDGGLGDALVAELAVIAQLCHAVVRRGPRRAQRIAQIRDVVLAEVAVTGEFEHAESLVAVIATAEGGQQLTDPVEVIGVVEIRHHLGDPAAELFAGAG